MASITLSKLRKGGFFFLLYFAIVSLAIADTRTTSECIGLLEGSGSYNSRPSALGHQGKYQMGVLAMIDAGFCTQRGTAQDSNRKQLWESCIITEKARAQGIKSNPDGSIDLTSFVGNGPAQEAAYQAYKAKNRQYGEAKGLYKDYSGKVINGVTITDDVIDYLIHHGGAGGAQRFLKSNGSDCVPDRAAQSSLCQSAIRMSDCMQGKATTPSTSTGTGTMDDDGDARAVLCAP